MSNLQSDVSIFTVTEVDVDTETRHPLRMVRLSWQVAANAAPFLRNDFFLSAQQARELADKLRAIAHELGD